MMSHHLEAPFPDGQFLAEPYLRLEKIPLPQGNHVEIIGLAPSISHCGTVSSPLQILHILQASHWTLNPKWQTSSHIYRVIADLHHRQRFTDLSLIYSGKLQLVLLVGKEPSESQPPDHLESSPRSIPLLVYVLPGIFRTATLSGQTRRELREEIKDFDVALQTLNFTTEKGWIIAVTDADDVSYYVEKSVTLPELMAAGGTEGTRDAVLSSIFGANRAINLRSLARKKERMEFKALREDRHRDQDLLQNSSIEQDAGAADEEDSEVAHDEDDTAAPPEDDSAIDEDNYDSVLDLIAGSARN
ncbi:hypothetical protein BV898_02363 [Hypsibius exemplaris]|uniref:Uncharacterized protein n=1 Tax=Hypsibius exemplaris TaxID=2072580 RepID=A0A1W0X888_HYPEX|nr:hypothetical protein BV898_02363 [Hypsibius exemplaris]